MKRIHRLVNAVLGAAALSCVDPTSSGPDPAPGPDAGAAVPGGMFVSNAVTPGNSANSRNFFVATAASTAYVSAAPGTFPYGVAVSLRNVTHKSGEATAPVVNGGLDPLGVSAEAEDELSLTVSNADHTTTIVFIKVPARRPPSVVRTSPSRGRTDVALNVQIEVVFTEPLDKSTLTSSSIGLLRNGQAVNGTISISDNALTAIFTPSASLEPHASYTLFASSAIRDLDGDALGESVNVEFTTVDAGDLNNAVPAGIIAFVSERDGNSEIYVGQADGTSVVRLTNNEAADVAPAWSPDGKRIAFVSDRGGYPAIYVMNADGSDVSRVTETILSNSAEVKLAPTWSSDGQLIAFPADSVRPSGIYVVHSDGVRGDIVRTGPSVQSSWAARDPSWSPDGRRIAFARGIAGDMFYTLEVMNSDGSHLAMPVGNGSLMWFDAPMYSQPSWSPKSDALAFVSCSLSSQDRRTKLCSAGAIEIVRINSEGVASDGASTLINGSSNAHPAWSPDGGFIAYSSQSCDDCVPSIHYVKATGGSAGGVVMNAHSPAWKPPSLR